MAWAERAAVGPRAEPVHVLRRRPARPGRVRAPGRAAPRVRGPAHVLRRVPAGLARGRRAQPLPAGASRRAPARGRGRPAALLPRPGQRAQGRLRGAQPPGAAPRGGRARAAAAVAALRGACRDAVLGALRPGRQHLPPGPREQALPHLRPRRGRGPLPLPGLPPARPAREAGPRARGQRRLPPRAGGAAGARGGGHAGAWGLPLPAHALVAPRPGLHPPHQIGRR
mmetsp:Transcript_56055/g.163785  ORF Transcript_56055/g.163785 Transcript_56055/m.163785 type:complete len:226 (+) Transcript_56055:532-1209(+)